MNTMDSRKFDKRIKEIHLDVIESIKEIIDTYGTNGVLDLGNGISYDICRDVDYDYMHSGIRLMKVDKSNAYDEDDAPLSLYSFNAVTLINFYKEMCYLYEK